MACSSPCNCHNEFEYVPCNAHTPCGESATCLGQHPCAYELQLRCSNGRFGSGGRYEDAPGGGFGATIDQTRIPLWRECLFLDEWTDRTCEQAGSGPGFGDTIGCSSRYGQENVDDTANYDDACEDSDGFSGGGSADHQFYGNGFLTRGDRTCHSCDGCTQSPFNKAYRGARWRLVINGLDLPPGGPTCPEGDCPPGFGAYLIYGECNGTSVETPIAVYKTNEPWICGGANELEKMGMYVLPEPDIYKYLPRQVCIRPLANNPIHPCGLGNSDICDCEDLGCPTVKIRIEFICDETYSLDQTFRRVTTGCDGVFSYNSTVNAGICAAVTWPDAPCGVFVAMLDTTCYPVPFTYDPENHRDILFLASCEGGNWTITTYCILRGTYGTTLTSVTEIDSQSLTRIDVCEEEIADEPPGYPQYWFDDVTIDASGSDCCEDCVPTVDTGCCDVPEALFATITAAGCAALNGTVINLAYTGLSGGAHLWSGSFAMGGTCGTVTVTFGVFDGASCEFYIVIKDGGGVTLWGGEGTPDQGTIGCPFTSATNSTVNIGIPACRISIVPPLCSGNMTITVTP